MGSQRNAALYCRGYRYLPRDVQRRLQFCFTSIQRLFSKKNMLYGMGSYAGVDCNSPYLIVNSVVTYPPPLQRERGGVRKIYPIGGAHLYLSAFSKTGFLCKHKYGEGGGRGES
jgi:hypothetical protein